jgi:myo-inositol 2-dehydrogenase/D-chiro-inositol 1-dehydrogenase
MATTVRIGFFGVGGIAQHHLNHLKEIPEAQIAALCDINEERVKTTAAAFGAVAYTDSAKMLAETKLDALYVCVPPHAHGDIEIRAAQKGLHLFVEKPVNLYIDQARKAADAIRKAGVMSQVGYSLRYLGSAMRLKEFLKDKEVGSAHCFRWGGLPGVPWWRRYDQGGGQLVEMTTHQVDLLRWVMGEVEAVSASYSFKRIFKDQPEVTVPDSQAVLLHFKSGASATINTICATGKTGMNTVDIAIKDAKVNWKHDTLTIDPVDSYPAPPAPAETPSIDASFVRAIMSGNAAMLRSPYEDGLKTAAVTLAANRSAENGGKLVRVSEVLGE